MAQAIDCLTSICTFIDAEKQKISAARKIKAKAEEGLKPDEESKQPSGQNQAAALQSDSSMVDESVNQGRRQSDELSDLGIEIEPGLRDQLRDQYIEDDYDENDENDAEESDESGDDDEDEDEDEDNLDDDESDDDDDDGDEDVFVRRQQRRRQAEAAQDIINAPIFDQRAPDFGMPMPIEDVGL